MRAFRRSDLTGEQRSADVISYAHWKHEGRLRSVPATTFLEQCKAENERLMQRIAESVGPKASDLPCDVEE